MVIPPTKTSALALVIIKKTITQSKVRKTSIIRELINKGPNTVSKATKNTTTKRTITIKANKVTTNPIEATVHIVVINEAEHVVDNEDQGEEIRIIIDSLSLLVRTVIVCELINDLV